jgi:hypothetical protein
MANMQLNILKITKFFCFLLLIIYCSCGKPSDCQAYEETLTSLSADKAQHFFKTYPESPYVDQLVSDLFDLCANEKDDQCCSMVLNVIPEKHNRYNEFKTLCNKNNKKQNLIIK